MGNVRREESFAANRIIGAKFRNEAAQLTFLLFQDGTTPLILAAAAGHIDAVTELLHQGADPNAKRLVSDSDPFHVRTMSPWHE